MTAILTPGRIARSEHPVPGAMSGSGSEFRIAGLVALTGVVLSILGSVLNQIVPGVDIFAAMETGSSTERALLLTEVADAQTPLVAGFAVWMIAFPVAAAATALLARLGRPSLLTEAIRALATASVAAIAVFLSMFIAFVVVVAPAHVAGQDVLTLAHTLGFTATTIDWIVSAIVLGLAPAVAVYAGRGVWAPRWLQGFAALALAATALEIGGLLAGARDLAFPLVPIGLLLHACAGVCALRHGAE